MVTVWTDHLSGGTLPSLLRMFLEKGPFVLHFVSATKYGRASVRILKALGLLRASSGEIEMIRQGERMDDPQSPYLEMADKAERFTEWFGEEHGPLLARLYHPGFRIGKERVIHAIRKVVATEVYDLLDFVESVRFHSLGGRIPAVGSVVMVPSAGLARLGPEWLTGDFEFVSPWSPKNSLLIRLMGATKQLLQGVVRPRRARPVRHATVAMTAAWGLNPRDRLNDLFWWWESGISPDRVVLCFDRPTFPARRDIVDEAGKLGIQCAVLSPEAVGDCPHLLWKPSPGPRKAVERFVHVLRVCWRGARRGEAGRWLSCRLLDILSAARWEDFLETLNVRAMFHHQETGLDWISGACERVGAVRIGHHWSYHDRPVASAAMGAQVCFAWGNHFADILDETSPCVDHVLLSGCIVKLTLPGGEPQGRREAARLREHGATRMLALFDTSVPCERFYEFFLEKVIGDARWGLLIKPKALTSVPWQARKVPHLEALYRQAVSTGRVEMLDPTVSTAEVAGVADAAVGVDISSAVVVAALAGRRAVHLDYVRHHRSPFSRWAHLYRSGPNRIVFDDPEELWAALNEFHDGNPAYLDLGLADKPALDRIDPFRDGRAGLRIGKYLAWYLEALDEGLETREALVRATSRYSRQWGSDKVRRGGDDRAESAYPMAWKAPRGGWGYPVNSPTPNPGQPVRGMI